MTTTERINTLMASISPPDNVFRRYTYAQNMAHKLTTNETLRTAMVLFLMANSEEERNTIITILNERFKNCQKMSKMR
jgi:hypothetical protein